MKLLVSVDNLQVQHLITEVAAAAGFDYTLCHDDKAAIRTYDPKAYQILISDSLELCRILREQSENDALYIIILISQVDPKTVDRLLNEGADEYLVIPLQDPHLLTMRLQTAARQVLRGIDYDRTLSEMSNTMGVLEQSHEDMQAILNQLRIGSGITGPYGDLSFLSKSAQQIFEIDEYHNKPWHEVFPFKPSDIIQLRNLVDTPADKRKKLSLHLRTRGGRYYWLDIEVFDDPVIVQRKIFFFYDMSEVYDLRRMLDQKAEFRDLVGKSKAMHLVYQTIQEVANVDITVSIEGETGTGKELVARAIHSSSHRKDQPFIAVNCAGFTDSLLASQLFGHKRGAFTGAHEDHKGVFESANGGTLFLDEIGEIPMNVQTSLLRVLQEREITRVGESVPRKVDVRVITATHRDLVREVELGTFRADLFFRIRVARLSLPPLRARREDIPLLVGVFLTKHRAASGKQVESVSSRAMNRLLEYAWPGNVRELENAIEYATIRCRGTTIHPQDLPPEIAEDGNVMIRSESTTSPFSEKERIREALEQAGNNRKKAAQLLGMSRATFYRRLSQLGLNLK